MQVDKLAFDRGEAEKLLRKYKEHKNWSSPLDAEIAKIAEYVSKGKVIVRGIGSVVLAGANAEGLPKLAIMRADQAMCYLDYHHSGRAVMHNRERFLTGHIADSLRFEFAAGALPAEMVHIGKRYGAVVPHIPPDIRPKRGVQNYTILWEAVWKPDPPVDPILMRRIGKTDFYMVCATWDLSPIERFVMKSAMDRRQ